MRPTAAALLLVLLSPPALAQSHGQGGHGQHAPHAGLKALSEEETADLRAGRGMGLALPAELNGYPGPRHVLELAEPLALTEQQRADTQTLFAEMQEKAAALGERIIASEGRLEALFAEATATPERLTAATAEAAALHGTLRVLHLGYHLEMMAVLTPDQVARYNHLRGYH